jgi:hypothetical protein
VLKPELKWKRRFVETGEGERERERERLFTEDSDGERERVCVSLRCG